MESHGGGIYAGEACEGEMVFESFLVPEIVALSEENSSVLEADLGRERKFELACGEVKYFQPDVVSPKHSTQALDNTVRSESVSSKCCNCAEFYEKMNEKWSWPEEHHSGQAQSTVRSVNSFQSTTDQLRVMCVQNLRSSAPVTTMVDSLYLENDRNICTQDFADSLNGLSLFEMGEQSKKGVVSDYLLASSDSNDSNTPADDFQRSPLVSFTKESIPREGFSDDLELMEEGSKLLLEDASSKQNLQHTLKGESCTNSRLSKSQGVSSSQLGSLADDERDLVCDVEEQRYSLISAATCGTDLPRFKGGDFEMEELETMQAESNTDVIIDSTCTAPCMDLLKDVQEVESPDLDKEFQVFDSSHGESEQGVIFSIGQQTDCPGSVVVQPDVREAVVVAVQISTEENLTKNGEENRLAIPSEATLAVGIAEAFYETKTASDLALLTMGELGFCLPPGVATLQSAEAKNAEEARKPIISLDRKTPELTSRSTAFSFENQLIELCNLGLGGPMQAASEDNASIQVLDSQNPGSDGGVSVAESLKVNNCAFKEELEESSSINMAFVPVTLEGSCEDYRPGNNGEAKAGKGQEKIQQHLWCYLFENMIRAIDELYCLCDLESDAEKIKEALLVLDDAGIDFEHLKARVDGFDRVNKGSRSSRTASAKIINSFLSTKKDLLQRRPHSTAWEVRRMACSQEQAGMPTPSLEDFKRVNGTSQSHSLQGRRRDTSQALSPESKQVAL